MKKEKQPNNDSKAIVYFSIFFEDHCITCQIPSLKISGVHYLTESKNLKEFKEKALEVIKQYFEQSIAKVLENAPKTRLKFPKTSKKRKILQCQRIGNKKSLTI